MVDLVRGFLPESAFYKSVGWGGVTGGVQSILASTRFECVVGDRDLVVLVLRLAGISQQKAFSSNTA